MPQVDVHVVRNELFAVAGVPFIPIEVPHYKLPVFGYGNFSNKEK